MNELDFLEQTIREIGTTKALIYVEFLRQSKKEETIYYKSFYDGWKCKLPFPASGSLSSLYYLLGFTLQATLTIPTLRNHVASLLLEIHNYRNLNYIE